MPGHIKLVKGAVDPDPTEFLWPSMDMKKEDQAKPYEPKQSVWIMDEKTHGYKEGLLIDGDILELGAEGADVNKKMTVQVAHEKFTLKAGGVGRVNPPKFEKCEDMVNLTYLNDASVFWNLKTRYVAKMIHTYSGYWTAIIEQLVICLSFLLRPFCNCHQSVQEVPDLHPQGLQDLSWQTPQ